MINKYDGDFMPQCPYFNALYNNYYRADNRGITYRKNFSTEEAVWIANYLNISFDKFDVEEFRIGLNVELEHGRINPFTNITDDDPILTGKITYAHLNEFPDYYKRLTDMEEKAEGYWEQQNK